VRACAAEAIGNCAGEKAAPAIPTLTALVKDADPRVRESAFHALGLLGVDPVPALTEALARPALRDWGLDLLESWPSLGIPVRSLPALLDALGRVRSEGSEPQAKRAGKVAADLEEARRSAMAETAGTAVDAAGPGGDDGEP
jgi:HEAT repeat protein